MVVKNNRIYVQYCLCFHYVHFFKPYVSCVYCCNLMCILFYIFHTVVLGHDDGPDRPKHVVLVILQSIL